MMRLALVLFGTVLFFSQAEAFLWFGKEDPIDTPPSVQTEKARPIYNEALSAERAEKYGQALRLYKRIYKKYPASDFTAQALYNSAVIYFDRHNWKKSFSAFQTILIYHPDFPRFNELVEYQFRIAMAMAEGDHINFLLFIPMRAYNRATSYFEIIIQNAPYSELAPLALMNVALIHQYKGNTAEAIEALDRLINNYPNSLLADDAYLSLAETFATLVQGPEYDQGATREAISYFEDFLILFSNNMDVARAEEGLADMEDVYARSKLVIGQYYFRYRGWYNAAEIFFNEAITIAPDSPAADTAREYLQRIQDYRASIEANPAMAEAPERKQEESFIRRWLNRLTPWK